MQTFRSAPVRLLCVLVSLFPFFSLPVFAAKVHVVTFGAVRRVPYTPSRVSAADALAQTITLKVRPLYVDGNQKEWTLGEMHEVTDRSFTIRRVMRVNDTLPGESERWSWQPGPWLLVDRITARITALHLPDFDTEVSEAVWFRDYAAYCGVARTVKGGLYAVVAQLGSARPVVATQISKWPQTTPVFPVCKPASWQREPMRVTLEPAGGQAMTYSVIGGSSLIEEGDEGDGN